MRIAVNLRSFLPGESGGIENFIREVVAGLAADDRENGHELTIFALDIALDAIRDFAPRAAVRSVPRHAGGLSIDDELNRPAYDVLFCPQLGLDPAPPGLPSVAMIPDLAPRLLPECFDHKMRDHRERVVAATVREASLVLTLSQHSRLTILDAYDIEADRVVVTYCDVGAQFRGPPPAAPPPAFSALRPSGEYLFFPANFWATKNHANLLAALALLARDRPELSLVLTGAPATGAERVRAQIEALGLADRVRMLGIQPVDVVASFMRHARALVFPTLFEGFGIPPLEAFHVGTPVVASGAAGNAEVVGDAALLVDPNDPREIADGVVRVLDDSDLRTELIERGRARTALFSWRRTIQIVSRSLRAAVEQSHPPSKRIIVDEPLRVSVVTPVYNGARLLAETIDSVLAQEYPYVDYIVLDGGSRDGTLDVLHRYDGRVRWYSRPDGGQADAVNRGFEMTRGDLFAFLNADDLYYPDTLWRVVAHFEANPGAAVIYGTASYINGDGEELGHYPTQEYHYELLGEACFICQPAAFITREVFARIGMLDATLHAALDYDLWIRIGKHRGTFVHVPDRLAASRWHEVAKSSAAIDVCLGEAATVAKRHYGYVPLSWVLAQAYSVTHSDPLAPPERSATSPTDRGTLWAALVLGLRHNPRQIHRFVTEWGFAASKFNGAAHREVGLRQNRDPRAPAGRRGIWLP